MSARRITLRPGDIVCIRDGGGATVVVDRGTAWLTQHGDRRDIVIEAGGSFRLDRAGVAVVAAVSADRTAELTVTAAAGASLPAIERSPRAPRAATLPRRLVHEF
jgi:hypothetical protein